MHRQLTVTFFRLSLLRPIHLLISVPRSP